jgi:hypothetical protein
MPEIELKACPFCGSQPLVGENVEEVTHPSNDCPAISGLWFTKAAWSTRATPNLGEDELVSAGFDIAVAVIERWAAGFFGGDTPAKLEALARDLKNQKDELIALSQVR